MFNKIFLTISLTIILMSLFSNCAGDENNQETILIISLLDENNQPLEKRGSFIMYPSDNPSEKENCSVSGNVPNKDKISIRKKGTWVIELLPTIYAPYTGKIVVKVDKLGGEVHADLHVKEITLRNIKGTILTEDKQPVPGATVFVHTKGVSSTGTKTVTGKDGTFTFTLLPGPEYTFRASSNLIKGWSVRKALPQDRSKDGNFIWIVEKSTCNTVIEVFFKTKNGDIEKYTDEFAERIAPGIVYYVLEVGLFDGNTDRIYKIFKVSLRNSKAFQYDLKPGRYFVKGVLYITKSGNKRQRYPVISENNTFTINSKNRSKQQNLSVTVSYPAPAIAGVNVKGIITDSSETPLSNIQVRIVPESIGEQKIKRFKTNKEGIFKTELPEGNYILYINSPDRKYKHTSKKINIRKDETIRIVLEQLYSLSGTVYNEDKEPVEQALAVVLSKEMKEYGGRTDKQGRFSINGLHKDEKYLLILEKNGYPSYTMVFKAGEKNNMQITLKKGFTIEGKIKGAADIAGKGFFIFVEKGLFPPFGTKCRIEKDGTFSVHLVKGAYTPYILMEAEKGIRLIKYKSIAVKGNAENIIPAKAEDQPEDDGEQIIKVKVKKLLSDE